MEIEKTFRRVGIFPVSEVCSESRPGEQKHQHKARFGCSCSAVFISIIFPVIPNVSLFPAGRDAVRTSSARVPQGDAALENVPRQ